MLHGILHGVKECLYMTEMHLDNRYIPKSTKKPLLRGVKVNRVITL